jgi:ectoine hydroxylase-related dioxygenase (phytanoyl-CoA dioxygenase family)
LPLVTISTVAADIWWRRIQRTEVIVAILSPAQGEQFRSKGYVLVEDAVTPAELASLRTDLAAWVEESRRQAANYGECIDGKPRFDLEAAHSAEAPRLRRINNPAEISEAYRRVAFESRIADIAAELVGPDTKFHHCKVNLKQPGSATRVGYHQDFSYTPHSNLDMAETLLLLDDMTLENGCLKVVAGSHRNGRVTLWRDGTFVGEIAPRQATESDARAEPILGRAGAVCIMHPLLLHGSDPNSSRIPRGLFICCYTAADAVPLSPSPLPNRFEGAIVRGRPSRVARLAEMTVELPSGWKSASFFEVQGQRSASGNAACRD